MRLLKNLALLLLIFYSNKVLAQEVHYMGALKSIMHKGDLSAKANLSDFDTTEGLYALGAVENLKGEVQIFNGKPYISSVKGGKLHFDTTYSKKATLLVYSFVEEWETVKIPGHALSYSDFEVFVAKEAESRDLDMPFPFLIQGQLEEVSWHTINWPEGDLDHSHEKHIHSGLFGTEKNLDVEMLGFYSDAHHALFTHHTTNMHVHLKTLDGTIAGHADGFILEPGMTLMLPKN